MSRFSTINFAISTRCNRRCPSCSAGIGMVGTWDATEDYMDQWSRIFQEVDVINIYGGEPLKHPDFGGIAARAREWFPGSHLCLATNGDLWGDFEGSVALFDEVLVSHYGEWTFPGCPDNTEAVDKISRSFVGKVTKVTALHKPRTVGKTNPCSAAHEGALEFREGVLYPCCTGSGARKPRGIIPDLQWRRKILQCLPQCEGCPFAS